jgi:uncharacterized protein YciI
MFVVPLRFSDNKADAPHHTTGHNAWIKQGLDDGVFLLAGSIRPGLGGAILAHNATAEELELRVKADPFVAENVVAPEIIEIAPGSADERLNFLLP